MKKKKWLAFTINIMFSLPCSLALFFTPTPPLPFLYFWTEVLSFSQSYLLSVCLQIDTYFPSTNFSLCTSLSIHHCAFSFSTPLLSCASRAAPHALPLLWPSFTLLHHVTLNCSCYGDHPHFPGMLSSIPFSLSFPSILPHSPRHSPPSALCPHLSFICLFLSSPLLSSFLYFPLNIRIVWIICLSSAF